jgi:hypothetical protein
MMNHMWHIVLGQCTCVCVKHCVCALWTIMVCCSFILRIHINIVRARAHGETFVLCVNMKISIRPHLLFITINRPLNMWNIYNALNAQMSATLCHSFQVYSCTEWIQFTMNCRLTDKPLLIHTHTHILWPNVNIIEPIIKRNHKYSVNRLLYIEAGILSRVR